MSKILKNVTGSPIEIVDTGVTIPANDEHPIDPNNYMLWAASNNIVAPIGTGAIVVNDGSNDLGISEGVDCIKGLFPKKIAIGNEELSQFLTFHGDRAKIDTTFNGGLSSMPNFWLELKKGNIPDYSGMDKFGECEHVPIGGTDVWNDPDHEHSYPFPTAAALLDINSDSADDTSAGIGCRVIKIYGLLDNWLIDSEIVTMNGLTTVNSTKQFRRVFRAVAITGGSTNRNQGIIRIKSQNNSKTIAAINPLEGQTNMAVMTVPGDMTAFIIDYWYSTTIGKSPEVSLFLRPEGECYQLKHHINSSEGLNFMPLPIHKVALAKTDIMIYAKAATGSHHLSAGFNIVFVKNP